MACIVCTQVAIVLLRPWEYQTGSSCAMEAENQSHPKIDIYRSLLIYYLLFLGPIPFKKNSVLLCVPSWIKPWTGLQLISKSADIVFSGFSLEFCNVYPHGLNHGQGENELLNVQINLLMD